jgi:hypothetical protein
MMVQRFLLQIKNSLWLLPSLYCVFSLILERNLARSPSYIIGTEICSGKYGYLQLMDYNKLMQIAIENNQILSIFDALLMIVENSSTKIKHIVWDSVITY